MFNPRFPHTLRVWRLSKDANGKPITDEEGNPSYEVAMLDKVVMIGDAPGDCDDAEKNGVWYYPILVNKENVLFTLATM